MTAHLRLSFAAVALSVLCAVALLLHSALGRIDEQRALRHRMVAERVFDEVERELGSLLDHEAERPSSAYDAPDTDVGRWSAFVVGYYKRQGPRVVVIAQEQLATARAVRLEQAVQVAAHSASRAALTAPASEAEPSPGPEPLGERRRSSPEVLRQLNRGVKVRQRRLGLARTLTVSAVDDNTVVIEREAPDGSRREGLVLDMPALVAALQRWVIDSQGLGEVATLGPMPVPSATTGPAHYAFSHRLAAPLQGHTVSLALTRLDDQDASNALLGLGALLSASLVLGLLALYRMVAVQVRFAERRNNFVSAVTHELRTPLTAIRMYGDMLREGMAEDDDARNEYYGIITSEAERLTRLINNVLEHGQLQKGHRTMNLCPSDVAAIVEEVTDVMAPHIEREGFALHVHRPADLPQAMVDADALKQVLFNLFDNALKYGRSPADPSVEVTLATREDMVRVAIRDHGPGLPGAHLQNIFEPFYRGERELTRRQQGTGIGLSLVKDLVERMHGQVRGRNAEPGFEIRVELPVAPPGHLKPA